MTVLNKDLVLKFLLSRQRSDGAILYTDTRINPYFGHIAARGLIHVGAYEAAIKWCQWCFANWNWPDQYRLYGTMCDFDVVASKMISTGKMDSIDSYAALFLMVLRDLWETGDVNCRIFLADKSYQVDVLGGVLDSLMDTDGLTWAKPDYKVKFLMDNCEVNAGLKAVETLFRNAYNDLGIANFYHKLFDKNYAGVDSLRVGSTMGVYKDANGGVSPPSATLWYPDVVSQFYPIYYDLALPYENDILCNANVYLWQNIPTTKEFSTVIVAAAAYKKGDRERFSKYIENLHNRPDFQKQEWKWFCAEAGWYLSV